MRARSSDREQRIAHQIEVVLAQEDALDKRRDDVRDREERLHRLERDLEQRRKELELLWSKRTTDLDERGAECRRAGAIARQALEGARGGGAQEGACARRGDVLARRAEPRRRVAAQRRSRQCSRPPAPEPAAPVAAADPEDTARFPLAPAARPEGGWNLNRIERLVEEHAAANPAPARRVAATTMLYLREHAEIGGAWPTPVASHAAQHAGGSEHGPPAPIRTWSAPSPVPDTT